MGSKMENEPTAVWAGCARRDQPAAAVKPAVHTIADTFSTCAISGFTYSWPNRFRWLSSGYSWYTTFRYWWYSLGNRWRFWYALVNAWLIVWNSSMYAISASAWAYLQLGSSRP